MKKKGWSLIGIFVALALIASTVAAKETVVVYTSLENEEIIEYLKLAKAELPDLDI